MSSNFRTARPRHFWSQLAVANAGGIGLVRLPEWPAPDSVRELIRRTRSLTARPFGVDLCRLLRRRISGLCRRRKSPCCRCIEGSSPRSGWKRRTAPASRSEQIGSLEDAAKAKEAGVDGISVQGCEAGDRVIGQEGLLPMLPKVVDLVSDSDTKIIAAGGIVDGHGYVDALALAAQGVCLGTRFLATEESLHILYISKT
ncbi:hypothetical protein QOZ80_8BG0663970 [Eleusine coracana subsp. coracana]|nr:hypothetical protein QOZ80_8BG0663970 [Eleusine coracana subsp. coracana]